MARKSHVVVPSLFGDGDEPQTVASPTLREDPYWFARTLSLMLFRGRPAICGGPFPRADIERQLLKVMTWWCYACNIDLPQPPETFVCEFEALFVEPLVA
jgi:hypothetical protein